MLTLSNFVALHHNPPMKPLEYEPHLLIPEENQGEVVNQLVETKMPSLRAQITIPVNRHNIDRRNARTNIAQMCQ